MNVQIEAPFTISDPMQKLIEEKVNKLTTYYDRITTAKIYLKDEIQRTHHKDERTVEMRVEVPGTSLFAEDSAETFEKAIAGAANKLGRQVRDFKEKLNEHH